MSTLSEFTLISVKNLGEGVFKAEGVLNGAKKTYRYDGRKVKPTWRDDDGDSAPEFVRLELLRKMQSMTTWGQPDVTFPKGLKIFDRE